MATKKQATLAIHGKKSLRGASVPVTTPIVQTTTYVLPNSQAIEGFMVNGEREHHLYGRYGNPTLDALQERMALIEGSEDALFFSSGMAAITTALLTILNRGDEVIYIPALYGQALNLFRKELPENHGITGKSVSVEDLYSLKDHVSDKTKLVYFESPTNPNLQIVDIKAVTDQAKELGLLTMIDGTFASPINQKPIELGVDYVVHSATKYIGGHSDLMAGVVCGTNYFVAQCKKHLDLYGAIMDPSASYLMIRSLATLEVRVTRQNESALKLAEYFNTHEKITRVDYPGLPDNPYNEVAKKQMSGFGGMVTIAVKGGKDEAIKVVDALETALNATSLGGVETLVSIPVITSHVWLSPKELKEADLLPSMIRISVGLEDVDDIITDFEQALAQL